MTLQPPEQADSATDAATPPAPAVLRMTPLGANPAPVVTGLDQLPGVANYFIGNDPAEWHVGIPTYSRVSLAGVYPGIDLAWYGTQEGLEYDVLVAPGADVSQVRLALSGARAMDLDDAGNLVLDTSAGTLTQRAPVAYQTVAGVRRPVESRFVLAAPDQVGFSLGAYDPALPLTIDPVVVYAGYIGGIGSENLTGAGVAVDGTGAAYVTGQTTSTEATFPDTVGPDTSHNGDTDAFVAKVAPDGAFLVYAGYIGGIGDDVGFGVAVDSAGAAYVTGRTNSTETDLFPVTVGPDTSHNGGTDAFVAKVAPDGLSLAYAGYIGGSGTDQGLGVAVDSGGAAYVTGATDSDETAEAFPVAGGPDLTHNGGTDAFVAKVAPGGALAYAGYIGGSGTDVGAGVAVDGTGAYVSGVTSSDQATFPVTVGPDLTHNGSFDAFVAKVNPAGTALAYAGYIGGSGFDEGRGVAVDSAGAAYVTGATDSDETEAFPVTVGPDLTYNGGALDGFVAKIAEPAGGGPPGGGGGDDDDVEDDDPDDDPTPPRHQVSIATKARPRSGKPGSAFRDEARLGDDGATGTLTFYLCRPDQVTRAGCPPGRGFQLGRPKRVVGDRRVLSDPAGGNHTATPGTYCWRVHYSGDANLRPRDHTNRKSECFTVKK